MDEKIKQKRIELLGEGWFNLIGEEFDKDYMKKLGAFLGQRRARATVHPSAEDTFRAYRLTQPERCKIILLAQDPYPHSCADGLCFSRKEGTKMPASLELMLRGIAEDVPSSFNGRSLLGDLSTWAEQGIFMLNSILTTEANHSMAHAGQGWETFTATSIWKLWELKGKDKLIFMLLGREAMNLVPDTIKSTSFVVSAEHPAAAKYAERAWKHNNVFSRVDKILEATGQTKIDW